jgi:hypothetical protein
LWRTNEKKYVFITQKGFSYIKLGDRNLWKGRGEFAGRSGNKYVDIKTKNNNKYYRWTGALNKTGLNHHTRKTVSGSSRMTNLISSIPPKLLPKNDSLFSLPRINRDPTKLIKTTKTMHNPTTKTKLPNLTISICLICSRTLSSNGQSSTKNSASKSHRSFPKNMTSKRHHDAEKMVQIEAIT